MSISGPEAPHQPLSHRPSAPAESQRAAAANPQAFQNVLSDVAQVVLPSDAAAKQQQLRNKKEVDRVEEIKKEAEEEEPILQQVQKIKKKIADLAKYEQNNLGL